MNLLFPSATECVIVFQLIVLVLGFAVELFCSLSALSSTSFQQQQSAVSNKETQINSLYIPSQHQTADRRSWRLASEHWGAFSRLIA